MYMLLVLLYRIELNTAKIVSELETVVMIGIKDLWYFLGNNWANGI